MNWEAIGAVGEIVGASAVLITLLYLAIQIKQARNDQKMNAIRNSRLARREFSKFLADSAHATGILAKANRGEALEDDEQINLAGINALHWGILYSEWIDRELGLAGEYTTSDTSTISFLLTTPSALDWFALYGRGVYPAQFVDYMERRIREISASDEWKQKFGKD